ncbi:hypothetical protein [Algoriphagus chordae]|uniref:Uncharacterized protein n=1 Tax=Algoriphagus chordae TaxID=237019 RepID=A0A2W7RXD4_9BACT|nr:hypothetical protein [Algoriphagus chordae]PZX55585.1 hypothetical protein LV85_00810 [Algoriphagus chordae]
MKKIVLIISLVTLSFPILAQSNQEGVDMIQSIFGMEKKEVVSEFISLEGFEADTFWALYDEYETKRKELGKARLDLLEVYAETYDSMDEDTADDILKEMMRLQISNDKLISSYSKKIKKKINVKTAAQFYQIEGYVLSKIRTEILENIPVIGSMDPM